ANGGGGGGGVCAAGPVRIPAVEIDAADAEGRTALMLAARAGHVEPSRRLIEAGADRETADHEGMTPWMLAAASGHEPAMRALLPLSPTPAYLQRKNRKGKTAYELAAAAGNEAAVAYLRPRLGDLVKDVKVEPPKAESIVGKAGDSPLFRAIESGDLETLQLLVREKVSIDGRDDKGRTALIVA